MALGRRLVPDDVAEAVAFYERALGLVRRFIHDSGQYAEMETGATALAFASHALVEANGLPPRPGGPDALPFGAEIALVTENVEAAFRRALDAGASAVVEPAARPWGQVVGYVRDPNGVLVELCTPIGGG
jgi:uncharacterized glyoxalase superfamily protein PhnB